MRLAPRAMLAVTSVALSAGLLLSRLPLVTSRRFDPDELEHAHVAWLILQGQVPYRDFFEHHTPLYHYLLAGFLAAFDPERTADAAMNALAGARLIGWVVSGLIAVCAFILARRLRDEATAWVALPLVTGGIVLALRAQEIRPDGLSTLLWLASLIALHAAVTREPAAPGTRRLFVASGLSIGLAVLTSQKLLLAGPAVAGLVCWYAASRRFGGAARTRWLNVGCQASAVISVWIVAAIWFAGHGAASDFVRLTLLDGLRWQSETTAGTVLTFIMKYEPWTFALAAGGAGLLLSGGGDRGARSVSTAFLLVPAGWMFAGLFLVPVPYAQYCLTFMPLFAILAASFLVETSRRLQTGLRPAEWTFAIVALAVGSLAWVGHLAARPLVVAPFVYPGLVAAALLAAAALARARRSEMAPGVLLVALSVLPAQWTGWMLELGDRGQFAELRYVLERTEPTEVVLDGWSGNGVFRPHAFYYWMLHPGVRAMLEPRQIDEMVEAVIDGRVAPSVIVLDDSLRAVSARLASFTEAHYRAAGLGQIYERPVP